MSNDSDYRVLLLAQVETIVSQAGFLRTGPPSFFTKQVDAEWSHSFLVLCSGERNAIEVNISAAIRSERIEGLFHTTSGFAVENQSNTFTLGVDCWRICSGLHREILITDAEILEAGVAECKEAFLDCAIPFYAEVTSLAAIDQLVNDDLAKVCIYRPYPWFRASTGIIVAKLLNRRDYDDLVHRYIVFMASVSKGFYLPRFKALLDVLSKM